MVKTASTMLPLGTKAPDFSLINVDGRTVSLADFKSSRALLIVFMCNHCPFVKHIADELAAIARDYMPQGVGMVGINSNDTSKHPEDSPEQMVHEAEMRGYMFPYLFDEEQEVAQAYKAACTPDFFLFDEDQTLVYRGQLDSSRPGNGIDVTGNDLRAAIDAVLAGRPIPDPQVPSIGCNIKWRSGHEPEYFNPSGVS
ncbi:MAG: thioredoxin family protein [Planctomycetales bacterium]|nr:thioredoxin family protein [Planctomycetales bacterium]MCA9163707.1 thioredoxin family protein [Planctomycetales bacterium]MCA9204166.1 thioredoxin family protein [Planctomycetales bacterium]MCA9208360.1 thioredoxin family protein [Planctomycetales bacterium]MCA9225356.1 thioredoxin family protein [Planctomycetales bacterium]